MLECRRALPAGRCCEALPPDELATYAEAGPAPRETRRLTATECLQRQKLEDVCKASRPAEPGNLIDERPQFLACEPLDRDMQGVAQRRMPGIGPGGLPSCPDANFCAAFQPARNSDNGARLPQMRGR